MRRFAVDAVEPASELLPTVGLAERHRHALTVGGDPTTAVIDHGEAHPLLASVAIAFAEHRPLQLSVESGGQFSIQRIADLPGGLSLCAATKVPSGEVHWLLCRLGDVVVAPVEIEVLLGWATALDPPSDIRVLAGSLADILEAAFTSKGSIEHLEVARFDQLLRPARR